MACFEGHRAMLHGGKVGRNGDVNVFHASCCSLPSPQRATSPPRTRQSPPRFITLAPCAGVKSQSWLGSAALQSNRSTRPPLSTSRQRLQLMPWLLTMQGNPTALAKCPLSESKCQSWVAAAPPAAACSHDHKVRVRVKWSGLHAGQEHGAQGGRAAGGVLYTCRQGRSSTGGWGEAVASRQAVALELARSVPTSPPSSPTSQHQHRHQQHQQRY